MKALRCKGMAVPATQPITALTEEQTADADADAAIAFTEEQTADADAAIAFTEEQTADADDAVEEVAMTKVMRDLLSSARSGDWKEAKKTFEGKPNLREKVMSTIQGIKILDAAVNWGQWEYFNELVQVMDAKTLAMNYERRDRSKTILHRSTTILHRVARIEGSMKSAKALVVKYPSVTQITDEDGFTPLLNAIYKSKDLDLVWYLASVTTNEYPGRPFTDSQAASLLRALISVGYYDIIHFLLQRHHHLAEILLTAETAGGKPVLHALASQPSDFRSGTTLGWLARRIYPLVYVDLDHFQPPSHVLQEVGGCSSSSTNHQPGKQQSKTSHHYQKFQSQVWNTLRKLVPGVQRIQDTKFKQKCASRLVNIACTETKWRPKFDKDPDFDNVISRTLKAAITNGISEILSIYMKTFPLSSDDINQYSLITEAIKNRQDKVFNLFLRKYPKSEVGILRNGKKGNILHIAAKLRYCPKITSIAGAAFQMQKELQWFKVIEKLVAPYAKQQINRKKQTPWQLFMEEHEIMREKGEKWMKETSNSCMLVATLIATVVFAAAFTVPGGNQQNGTPIFLQKNTFLLFAVFDALALFSSINSLWMFLSILTARFAFEDFLQTLPKRLVFGLAALFLAIVSSMTAFGAALSLVLGHRQNVVIVLIVLMALISVTMFAILQLPLFIEMVRSTYCRKLLGS